MHVFHLGTSQLLVKLKLVPMWNLEMLNRTIQNWSIKSAPISVRLQLVNKLSLLIYLFSVRNFVKRLQCNHRANEVRSFNCLGQDTEPLVKLVVRMTDD